LANNVQIEIGDRNVMMDRAISQSRSPSISPAFAPYLSQRSRVERIRVRFIGVFRDCGC
jgi:hypothetical protein